MKRVEEIDMAIGMLSGEGVPKISSYKVWIMGNTNSEIIQKRCLVEGREGFELLKNHAIIGQMNVKNNEGENATSEFEQTPFGVNLDPLISKHILLKNNVLWKYMASYKFEDMIKNKHLHYSRLDQFSDNLEGLSPFSCKRAIAATPNLSREDKIRNIRLYNNRMQSNRKNSFASCWHINNKINYPLWKEYGDNSSESICIRTSIHRLETELKKTKFSILNETVQYFKEPFFNQNAYWYPTLFKRDTYKNEREFRSILFVRDLNLKFSKIKINPEKLITKIFIHPSASKEFYQHIKKLIRENKMCISVQRGPKTFDIL